MDKATMEYLSSKQGDWAIEYQEQRRVYKLAKNRAEKQRVKDAKNKANLKSHL